MSELEIPTYPGKKGFFSRIKESLTRQKQPEALAAKESATKPAEKVPDFSTKPLEEELSKINSELGKINKQLGTKR